MTVKLYYPPTGRERAELRQAFTDVLDKGAYINGENVKQFEFEAARELDPSGPPMCVGVNSGTDALKIALRCVGARRGLSVVLPAFTFTATASAVAALGCRLIFADIDEDTWCLDIDALPLDSDTVAIVPVHLYGYPMNVSALRKRIEDAGRPIAIIEDACQSFGAFTDYGYTGTLGDIGCFSFFPTKPLGGFGDGGMLATYNHNYRNKALDLRAHGSEVKYHPTTVGYNSRLDEIQAALLRIRLKYAHDRRHARRAIAEIYSEAFRWVTWITTPKHHPGHAWHQYTILVEDRDHIRGELQKTGIETGVYYPKPLHETEAFFDSTLKLPTAEYVADHCLSLPIHHSLERKQVDYVVSRLCSM